MTNAIFGDGPAWLLVAGTAFGKDSGTKFCYCKDNCPWLSWKQPIGLYCWTMIGSTLEGGGGTITAVMKSDAGKGEEAPC